MRIVWLAPVALTLACGARTAPRVEDVAVVCRASAGSTFPVTSMPLAADRLDVLLLVFREDPDLYEVQLDGMTSFLDGLPATVTASDARFAVATYDEFPLPDSRLPPADHHAFTVLQPLTESRGLTRDVLRDTAWPGFVDFVTLDGYRAQVEALYSTITGEGLAGRTAGVDVTWIPPAPPCPDDEYGAVCFRHEAMPIILLVNLRDFHNGPGGAFPYDDAALGTRSWTYPETVDALRSVHARVPSLVFDAFGNPVARDPEVLAADTDTTNAAGAPVVVVPDWHPPPGPPGPIVLTPLTASEIASGATAVAAAAQEAITETLDGARWDVTAVVRDTDPSDGVDAAALVRGIQAISAVPSDGFRSIDTGGTAFVGARAGTRLTFSVAVAPSPPVSFDVCFLGYGTQELGCRHVRIQDCPEAR